MAEFKVVISDRETGRAYQRVVEKDKAKKLIGLKITDEFDGGIVGLPGYRLRITGGTDKSGFAMRRGIKGSGRKRILLSAPPCYHPKRRGERRRKNVRGETISEDIAQINTIIVEKGSKPVEELLGKGEEKKEK